MASEITEENEEDDFFTIKTQAQKDKIRRIIDHQKSVYLSSLSSSSSFSSAAASCSSFSSSRSLLDLMREGNTSLRRLFDMEHTSLATHLKDYSGSPAIRPILLWGSDTDNEVHDDIWKSVKRIGHVIHSVSGQSVEKSESDRENRKPRTGNRKLTRTRSFRRLPRFSFWRCRGFRFRIRLRIRVMICGRKF
ncbi:ATP-dependent Clp protease proteolytic subunit like [Actinidia chinensis var. chinensis]|uniref:ATP-dependent Clp protease proteolytic subunit like n=1 Tax=Actinidia chinensis var. chinensis TaxID=1590841 RepID=A0A2R6RXB6_ACTCC|nr:ATP-dependent Clp protease proteolytic subunit like [Actinidia chinensis var. chinensis]